MTDEEYGRILKEFREGFKISSVEELPDLVKVDIRPRKDWGICTFVFCRRHIVCFGDVTSFSWRVTWDAAAQIKLGNCNANNIPYLSGKLENKNRLERFEFSDSEMDAIKAECSEGLEGEELAEFEERWKENYWLLGDVDEYRLNGLDEFFREVGIVDAWEYYPRFQELPAHYYCAVAMLRCIEDYFTGR